jgi:uncharacterized protein YjbI with pentapeptide repeats
MEYVQIWGQTRHPRENGDPSVPWIDPRFHGDDGRGASDAGRLTAVHRVTYTYLGSPLLGEYGLHYGQARVQGTYIVQGFFYRIFVALFKLNMTARRLAFQVYLNRRKHRLAGADLSFLSLRKANLHAANLRGANLIRADLGQADLSQADLREADLSGANLVGADLSGARLTGAQLSAPQLAEAKSLAGATMPDGRLYGAKGERDRGQLVQVGQAPATRIDWRGRDLHGRDLHAADLAGANLQGANLRGADMFAVDLRQADLSGANLTGALVLDEQLALAGSLEGTIRPGDTLHA